MSKHWQRDLTALQQAVLAMSSQVEEMIEKACRALRDSHIELVDEVIQLEEGVNEQEVQIEEECLKILALHQPVAIDLRRAAMLLKINNDLERMADLAVNIAERTRSLSRFGKFMIPERFDAMARLAIGMVNASLDAFVHLDSEAAREICHQDNLVDDINRQNIDEMYRRMRDDSESVEPALQFFSCSRHVERIADLATNIAEDVIFLVEGEIARHRTDESEIPLQGDKSVTPR
jgi:phosphate transport system protein